MSKFAPDNFKPSEKNILWAIETFNVSRDEVQNQVDQLLDHEFKRSYTEWQRVFRNWMRTANKHGLLLKERVYYKEEVISDEQKKLEAEKANKVLDMLQFKQVK